MNERMGSSDWRSNLFTVFMDNLSNRVSKSALWEAFLEYGKVVDIYIPRHKNNSPKANSFPFVKYKLEAELKKAIENGNNRRVNGRHISVKKAAFEWKDRRKYELQWRKKPSKLSSPGEGHFVLRDNRSYREALMGSGYSAGKKSESNGLKREGPNNVTVEGPPHPSGIVNYDLDIPKAKMEWLDKSAIGNIKVDRPMN